MLPGLSDCIGVADRHEQGGSVGVQSRFAVVLGTSSSGTKNGGESTLDALTNRLPRGVLAEATDAAGDSALAERADLGLGDGDGAGTCGSRTCGAKIKFLSSSQPDAGFTQPFAKVAVQSPSVLLMFVLML